VKLTSDFFLSPLPRLRTWTNGFSRPPATLSKALKPPSHHLNAHTPLKTPRLVSSPKTVRVHGRTSKESHPRPTNAFLFCLVFLFSPPLPPDCPEGNPSSVANPLGGPLRLVLGPFGVASFSPDRLVVFTPVRSLGVAVYPLTRRAWSNSPPCL